MSEKVKTDIAIIGGGPAGLSAAQAARQSGASVVIIDSFPLAGGQYYMQPVTGAPSGQALRGRRLIDEVIEAGAHVLTGHEVVAAYPGFRLLAMGHGRGLSIAARAIVVAGGAHDRVMAFPGWTLPGVMTAGAGQRLAKVNGVLPGQRIVIAGTGIFLWAVADTLLQKGARIVALVEARRPSLGLAAHILAFPEHWREALRLFNHVKRGVDRVAWSHVICEASGDDRVDSVIIGHAAQGRVERITGVDALLVSHGFQPNIEITSLLGCEHCFDEALGGWHAIVDDRGRTSIKGIYAAGEVTGLAGFLPATLAGRIAGMAAAIDLGMASDIGERSLARWSNRLRRALRFGHGLGRLFEPLPALQSVQRDNTILCRCEEISRAEILAACRDGARHLHTMKTWTRAGMGRCQGRMCRMSVTACIAKETGKHPRSLGYNKPRVPTRPIPINEILAALDG